MKPNTRFKKKWKSLSLPVQLLVIVASTLLPFLAFALGGWVFLALFIIFIASPFYTWFIVGHPRPYVWHYNDVRDYDSWWDWRRRNDDL